MTADKKWVFLSLIASLGPFVVVMLSVGYLVYNQAITRSILRDWIVRHEVMHRQDRNQVAADHRAILGELKRIKPESEPRR